ncbi:hypothetical protein RND81_12G185400 [Saponaria officinalis]|uniref:WW domain-containing protein n=1 Tax=Saponaria officinalis TaxID=3572 RepID=A0AAW1HCC4_SAPOF
MGKKRNERRLAAKIGAGRRVKLDLFAEPSGELGDSSPKDEVEKDVDAKHDRELSNSPPSGQHVENPLSLLGQYSDDELDDASNKAESELHDINQAIESFTKHLEEGEIGENEDHSFQKADNQCPQSDSTSVMVSQILDADSMMHKMVTLDEKNHEVDGEKQDPAPLTLDVQTSGNLNSSWKMVLHEESNRYYYWNTVTGETSWETPEGFVQGSALADGLESLKNDMEESASGDVYNTTAFGVGVDELSAGHGVGFTNGVSQMKMVHEQVTSENHSAQHSKGDDNHLLGSSSVVGAMPHETSTLGNYMLPEQYSSVFGNLTMGSYAVHGDNAVTSEQSIHLPSQLAKQSETLLQNLKLLLGSGIDPGQHAFLSRHMSEIEVRLSDIRALLPYGPSLLPFWVHTERELNQLENSINTEVGKQHITISGTYMASSEENHVKQKSTGDDSRADTTLTKPSPEISSAIANEDAKVEVRKESHDEVFDNASLNNAKTSVSGHITASHFCKDAGTGVSDTAHHEKANPKLDSKAFEDVDMDIDMEVEAPSPPRVRSADIGDQLEDQSQLLVHSSTSVVGESLVSEGEFVVPPPPEEEWIPPPPPDDEGIPPPPPNEPPESLCPLPPPSEPEAVLAIYGEHYNMNYAESNVNCYENITASSTSSLYEHAGSSQIAALSLPDYFATAQQPIVMPDGTAYWGLQKGSLSVVPIADAIQSTSSLASASFLGCDSISLEKKLDDVSMGVCSAQVANPLSMSAMSGTFLGQASSSSSVLSASTTVSGKQHASAPFSAAETAATASNRLSSVSEASTTVSKGQSKAPRMKKPKVSVASSFGSNKKVSSMVDKWKAAKEELQEEEERRETPLEILERKRQREIEDWRAQQIASGEAKENANFQPLGGNWRERVKRRRAQKEAATKTPSDPTNEGIKQPDLKSLSKDLLPGWQVKPVDTLLSSHIIT